ncbi:MAG: tetratricopeptide repeat protein [Novosphingobium sp.]|nr:tetratricopeptide repeat protein [Novosphingobium sp.]
MIRNRTAKSPGLISRAALAGALGLAVVVGGTFAAPEAAIAAKAPKMNLSKGFVAAAQPAQAAIGAVVAGDAATEAAAKAAVDAAVAAASSEDDKYTAGSLLLNLGSKAKKAEYQRQGVEMMLASGKASAEAAPQLYAAAGQLAYQAKDYANAERYLTTAVDLNKTDPSLKVLLGETYISNNQVAKGMGVLKSAIQESKASGQPAPESWYKRGIASAYRAKATNEAAEFGAMLIMDYPTSTNVGLAATIVRELANYGGQDNLDLMRLMGRSNGYNEARDYIEYIQAADPRRLPGETLDVINAGIASGKLKANDVFITDAKTQASGRLAADKASLVSYEADARKPSATETTISGAADTLLSYGKAAQAEDLYKIALTKPGVDTARTLTRLGIAQVDEGKYAEAQATFAKVTGPRMALAKLWSGYAASKAKPAAAAAPASN